MRMAGKGKSGNKSGGLKNSKSFKKSAKKENFRDFEREEYY